jgi:hypothetical protein
MTLNTETTSDHPIGPVAASLSRFAEIWLAEAESRLSRPTYLSYRSLLRCYVLPTLGARSVSSLTGRDVDAFEVGLIGKGLAPGTIANAISVLRLVLSEVEALVPCNPAARANRPSLAAPAIGSDDWVIPFRAAKATGVHLDTLRYWIERGRVAIENGRVLVGDVERERDLKTGTYALYEVMRELRCTRGVVKRLISAKALAPPIRGRYEKTSVDRIAKQFERDRTERISFNAAVEAHRDAYNLTWSGLEQILERERIPVVVRAWHGRGTRLISRAPLEDTLRRLKKQQQPCRCGCGLMPSLGSGYLAGHSFAVAVAKSLEPGGLANRAAGRRDGLKTPAANAWRASVSGERVDRIPCPCAICGEIEFLAPSQMPRWGRTICDLCWPLYLAALQRANHVVTRVRRDGLLQPSDHEAFTKLLAVGYCGGTRLGVYERDRQLVQLRKEGQSLTQMAIAVELSEAAVRRDLWQIDRGRVRPCCFEHAVRAVRPRKRGAQPPIGLDLVIAALHWAGFTDARTTELIRQAQRLGRLTIPRVVRLINDGYVKERRELRGIGRRPSGHGTTEDARRVLAQTTTPLHLHEITRRMQVLRGAGAPAPDEKAVGTVLRKAAAAGRIFRQTAPATFTLLRVPSAAG